MFACCDDSRDLSAAYVRIALEGVSWAVVSPIVLQLGHFVRLSAWNAKTQVETAPRNLPNYGSGKHLVCDGDTIDHAELEMACLVTKQDVGARFQLHR